MRKMKDCGIEWIGDIPEDWEINKVKYVANFFNGDRGKNYPSGDDMVEEGIPFLSSNNIHSIKLNVSHDITKYITEERYNILGGAKIKVNDIIYCLRGSVGLCSINETENRGTVASSLTVIRPTKINPYFLNYILNSKAIEVQTKNFENGSCAANLSAEDVGTFLFVSPSLPEQKKIADFLDAKCADIDQIRADIEKQIEILSDYKKSIITEAVTKGLDPKAKMKDSGIEWIGKIPEHWTLTKIGSVYSLRSEKVSDKVFAPLSVTKNGILPQLESVAKTDDGDNRKLVRKGDFVINSRSDRRGSCGISYLDGSVSLINTVLKPRNEMNPRYYNWLFHTELFADEFYSWGHGIVDDLWTTRWQEMKNILIPVPTSIEQKAIASYLDEKCSEIDATIAEKQKQLETLEEYKKSLIFEYVTGKKEVV